MCIETENWKEVYFNEYCPKCSFYEHEYEDNDKPDVCNDCLNETVQLYSHKPYNFKAK